MEEEMSYEYPVFKAPCEGMNKDFRQCHKALEKEVTQVVGSVGEMRKSNKVDKEAACAHIDKLVGRLQGLKRKVGEAQLNTTGHISSFRSRVDHFKVNLAKGDLTAYNQARTDRVLVDYMLRAGFYDSAIHLAREANITALVDIDIFISSKKVIEGLLRHDCHEALQWCADNRSKLKKIKSDLEFSLRIQEFIELVRSAKLEQAIAYSRKHLAPCASTNMREIQKAMAALAFPTTTACARYKPLFDPQRWDDLVTRFQHDSYALHSLTLRPLLSLSLQAGLSALKTSACVEACAPAPAAPPASPAPSSPPAPVGPTGAPATVAPPPASTRNINCPVCNAQFNALAAPLPIALHSHSCLVCRVTGAIMNEDNPPMALPNGYVYSRAGVNMIAARNGGKVVCPVTGAVCRMEDLRKVFIS